MTLQEAVKERHSVRNYRDMEIEQSLVDQLEEKIKICNEEGNLHLQFVKDAGNTFNRLLNKAMGLGSAPSVIACIGPDDETLDERVGYYGQQVVLLAQQLGLNTCWAGTFNPKNVKATIGAGERLVIVIAIGYGVNNGRDRKSKTFEKVTKGDGNYPKWFADGVEAALLAPTAINQQKFVIALENETVKIENKGGVMGKVDLGIVKYNFEVGSGKKIY